MSHMHKCSFASKERNQSAVQNHQQYVLTRNSRMNITLRFMSIPGSSVGRAQDSYKTKMHLVVKGSSPFLGDCFLDNHIAVVHPISMKQRSTSCPACSDDSGTSTCSDVLEEPSHCRVPGCCSGHVQAILAAQSSRLLLPGITKTPAMEFKFMSGPR